MKDAQQECGWQAQCKKVFQAMPQETTILLVEDDPNIRETFKDLLELEGYRVAEAANGLKALDYLAQSPPPALILLDLMMPVLNGWQFLERLHLESPKLASTIPIILVSAAADSANGARQLARGMLRKPVEMDALLRMVEQHCVPS